MIFFRAFTLLCCLVISGQVYAQIYKWTDENGKIQFGDKPPQSAQTNEVILNKTNVIGRDKDARHRNRRKFAVVPYEQRGPGENGLTLPDGRRVARPRSEAEVKKYEALLRAQVNARLKKRMAALPARAKQKPTHRTGNAEIKLPRTSVATGRLQPVEYLYC